MSRTFKAWLIANFEMVFGTLVIVVSGIYTCLSVDASRLRDVFIIYFGVSYTFNMFISLIKNEYIGIGIYILFILYGIYVHYYSEESEPDVLRILLPYYWGIFIFSSVIGGFLTRYAYLYFDEVVSRRMVWRNSNVDLFEIRWKYVLARFSGIVCSLMFGIIWLAIIIYIGITDTW